jgi:hypothetical protein
MPAHTLSIQKGLKLQKVRALYATKAKTLRKTEEGKQAKYEKEEV